jgi:hypothetical protein
MLSTEPQAETYEDQYVVLLGEIDTLLADARRKVNDALLASIEDSSRLRALTRLDRLLADPAQLSHDLLRTHP